MISKASGNQDVSTALKLLSETLDEESTRIYDKGVEAMKKRESKTAQAVLDFAKEIESFQRVVDDLISKWNSLLEKRNSLAPEIQEIVTGEGILFPSPDVPPPPPGPMVLRVTFPDGTVIKKKTSMKTLINVINKIGPGKVAKLGIENGADGLVARKPGETYVVHRLEDGYFLNAHSDTDRKKIWLEEINNFLRCDLCIELVPKE